MVVIIRWEEDEDFTMHHEVIGPFASEEEARQWYNKHPCSYGQLETVSELTSPTEVK